MLAIDGAVGGARRTLWIGQEAADIVVQAALVAFERQNVVSPLLDHLCGNDALAVQRVGRDDVPLQRQKFRIHPVSDACPDWR